ncbi:hypothetical protein ABR737_11615 [Streptomyces sp. Edi2]|uniref:hypothetical protein n=1 Tax=Streptomyces sp. Edi2 TaxID=3162528 RepID=UPI0033068286
MVAEQSDRHGLPSVNPDRALASALSVQLWTLDGSSFRSGKWMTAAFTALAVGLSSHDLAVHQAGIAAEYLLNLPG